MEVRIVEPGTLPLFFQPFYRIGRLAVDPQLEIEGRRSSRRPTHRAKDLMPIDMRATLHG